MKAKRLAFAKAHQYWTNKHGSKMLFSNESTIQLYITRKQNVPSPQGKRYNKKVQPGIIQKSNNLGGHVMQWDSWFILFALWHDYEWSKVPKITE